MPTYEYACTSCRHHLEVFQSFSEEPLTTCPNCEGDLRKVFGSIGIVLKGSGFYRTDSRSASSTKSPSRESEKKEAVLSGSGSESAASGSSSSTSSSASSSEGSTSSPKAAASAG